MESNLTTTSVKPKHSSNTISWIAPIGCLIVGYLFFRYIIGADSGFSQPGEGFWFPEHHGPLTGKAKMYLGGFIVPILLAFVFMIIVFSVERFLTIRAAQGTGNNAAFVRKVQIMLADKDLDGALAACDKQKGAVGNVMKAGLIKYQKMINATEYTTDQKISAIQKEVEEATALELPMLQRNLVFLSTLTSLSVLVALLGTVMGMIKSFGALGEEGGSSGASQLAVGIAEALYNTATGITGGALALVMYNVFTTKIDSVTHSIDESGFTLTQSFASLYK